MLKWFAGKRKLARLVQRSFSIREEQNRIEVNEETEGEFEIDRTIKPDEGFFAADIDDDLKQSLKAEIPEDLEETLSRLPFHHFMPLEETEKIDFSGMKQVNLVSANEFEKIPALANKLDFVVQKPGIYRLSDMKNYIGEQRYDFLKSIPQPDQVDFSQIPPYNPPSTDTKLLDFARKQKCKYLMSTSTISYFLSHLYYSLSFYKEPNFGNVGNFSQKERTRYMNAQKKPYTSFMKCLDKEKNLWAFDSDSGMFTPNHLILIQMGKILERVYTMEPDHFNATFIKDKQNLGLFPPVDDDYHRFMVLNDKICLRSQIDCKTTMPDGKHVVFEIKSRALAPIRYDIFEWSKYLDYYIDPIYGELHSYEREYYDLIRGAMLKYFFQLKIGQMDGAFVGYHNSRENFGFEYVKMSTIEKLLFSSTFKADMVFMLSTRIMSHLLDKIIDAIKSEEYEFVKIGYYSDPITQKFVTIVELLNHDYLEFKNLVMDPIKGMENVVDYYGKVLGKKNLRAIKFETKLYPILNGIHNPFFLHDLREGDVIDMEISTINCGYISYEEYMHFLLSAYKYEYTLLDSKYMGNWLTQEKKYTL